MVPGGSLRGEVFFVFIDVHKSFNIEIVFGIIDGDVIDFDGEISLTAGGRDEADEIVMSGIDITGPHFEDVRISGAVFLGEIRG